jgi:anti-sigma regulatory factor (Ser/Thr protein kinase)
MTPDLRCPVRDPGHPAEARRSATALALEHGFGEEATGSVALVVTEAATNLVKHAGGGEILLRAVTGYGDTAIEMLALDRGRGMRDVAACYRDGYSTSGSPGTGLGAIARLSAFNDIYSQPGRGTAMLARMTRAARPTRRDPEGPLIGGVAVAKPGEQACGDRWAVTARRAGMTVAVVDGLGHGPLAAEAAELAVQAFQRHAAARPRAVLAAMHVGLHGTRGAAAAVVELDDERALLTFVGVGNIAGVVVAGGATRGMVSHNGIVGQIMANLQEFTYPWPPGALVVLHSDGITARWKLDAYPDLEHHHPSLIAAILYRDFSRGRDDTTVVVLKGPPG